MVLDKRHVDFLLVGNLQRISKIIILICLSFYNFWTEIHYWGFTDPNCLKAKFPEKLQCRSSSQAQLTQLSHQWVKICFQTYTKRAQFSKKIDLINKLFHGITARGVYTFNLLFFCDILTDDKVMCFFIPLFYIFFFSRNSTLLFFVIIIFQLRLTQAKEVSVCICLSKNSS